MSSHETQEFNNLKVTVEILRAEREEYVTEAERLQRKCIDLVRERNEYKAKAVRLTEVLDKIANNPNSGVDHDGSSEAWAKIALEKYGVKE